MTQTTEALGKAVQLFHEDGKPAGIWYCSHCRIVHKTEGEAARCHGRRLCECGQQIKERYYLECSDCRYKKQREEEHTKEMDRFAKARKITLAEYDESMVYLGDRYYDTDDIANGYLDGDEPEYVWACKNIGLPLATLEDVIDRLLDAGYEDMDASDLYGLDELQAALDKFNEENRAVSVFEPDYSTAILVAATEQAT